MAANKLVSEFLDELRDRADKHFKGRLHQAFLDWYVEAEFGDAKWTFTDDVKDGGIDAIVWRPDEMPPIAIIQSKFSESFGTSKLQDKSYKEFKKVVAAFRDGDELFEDLLSRVRSDLRVHYRRAFEALEKADNWHQRKKAFRLITSRRRRGGSEFDGIPSENYFYRDQILRLYEDFRQAQTPKAKDLRLSIGSKLPYTSNHRGLTSYLFNARVEDFRKYLEYNDVARLLARNIRYDLGSKVGKEIRATYEKSPSDFWYFHNGLTIICDDFVERQEEATLVAPSVVNGAQTLYAISGSSKRTSSALVPVKVIVRSHANDRHVEDDDWLQKVIRSVNSQNRVRSFDLRSNEPEQILLQNRFREFKVYYERKRGEWREVRNEPRFRDFERLSLSRLGSLLTAVSGKDGNGVLTVKKGLDYVFEEKNYRKLFPNRTTVARRFERIYLAYRLFAFLEKYGYRNTPEWRRMRHGFWNSFWVLHDGVASNVRHSVVTPQSIKRVFDAMEGYGRLGRYARKSVRQVVKTVWQVWRRASKKDRELWTPNNFFKSRFGIKAISRLAIPKIKNTLSQIGLSITTYGQK